MSHSRNEHLGALVNYLPGGRMYSSALRTDSNLYKFLYGLSNELKKAGDYTERYRDNILPDSKPRGIKVIVPENEITSPSDLTDASWIEIGTSVAAYDAIGLENKENTASTLTDNDGASHELMLIQPTIANDSSTHTAEFWIKKDADTSRFVGLDMAFLGGTLQNLNISINTSSGATGIRSSNGINSHSVEDRGTFWRVVISVTNNSSGNVTASLAIYPAVSSISLTSAEVGATGSCIVGYVVLQLNTPYDTTNNVLANNSFNTDTLWTKGAGWAISGESAVATAATASIYQVTGDQLIPSVAGKIYVVKYTISDYTTGSLAPNVGGTLGAYLSGDGEHIQLVKAVASNSDFHLYPAAGFTGKVNEVSVRELILQPVDIFDEARGTGYDFVEEWERVLGIPDSCFPGPASPSTEIRKRHILAKLASLGVQTEQDFIDLASVFNLSATVIQTSSFSFEITTTVLETIAFPLTFPIVFSISQTGVYQCLITKLKPANTNVTFKTI